MSERSFPLGAADSSRTVPWCIPSPKLHHMASAANADGAESAAERRIAFLKASMSRPLYDYLSSSIVPIGELNEYTSAAPSPANEN